MGYMETILFALYDLILLVLSPLFFVVHMFLRLARNKRGAGFPCKFFPAASAGIRAAGRAGGGGIWIHAVSLGEQRASVNLVRLLKEKSGRNVYVSATTGTGYDFAKKTYEKDGSITVFYFPFDIVFSTASVLKRLKPALFVSVETEIWPGLFRALRRKGIPSAIVNARISDRSFARYSKFGFFFKFIFRKISAVLSISESYREKFTALGVPEEAVYPTGNMKFDMDVLALSGALEEKKAWLEKLSRGAKIVTAGSTHRGEEKFVLNAVERVVEAAGPPAEEKKPSGCDAYKIFLLIAPRHPERFDEVFRLLQENGREPLRLSSVYGIMRNGGRQEIPDARIVTILIDIMGELLAAYSVCDAAFVGGSMVAAGGHNMLEPLLFGKPVAFGEHVENFSEIAAEIIRGKAGKEVRSAEDLSVFIRDCFCGAGIGAEAAVFAKEIISRNAGSSEKNADSLISLIEKNKAD